MSDSKQTKQIKDYLVKAYRRGVCDHNGGYVPPSQRGRNGKGSHFRNRETVEAHPSQLFQRSFEKGIYKRIPAGLFCPGACFPWICHALTLTMQSRICNWQLQCFIVRCRIQSNPWLLFGSMLSDS
jgi:hypothetical protein